MPGVLSPRLERQLADLKPGDHVCSIYEDPHDLLALATGFVKTGLARGGRCVYAADDRTVDEVRDTLAGAGVDTEREQERGALRLLTKWDAYLRNGEFCPAAMLEFLRREERQALADGFSGLWCAGEMTWALGREPGTDRLIEYEALVDQMAGLRRSVILCQYNAALFGRPGLHDVIHTHSGGVLRPVTAVPGPAAGAAGDRDELYRFLMENTHDIVSLYDVDGRRVYVSPSIRRLLGWVPAEPFEGIHPDDLPAVREAWGRASAGGRTVLVYRHAHADGSWRWLESSGSLVRFRGRPHVLAITRDVTDQRRAEDAIREREELLRLLTENTAEFIRFFDPAGTLVYANPAVQRLLGEVPADFAGFPHPEDREPSLRWFERVLAGGTDPLHWRVRTGGGEWRWMETRGTLVRYHGCPYVLTICHDVTDQRQAEEALRESERKLSEAQRLAHIGYWERDLAADRITWSEETGRILGLPARGVLSQAGLEAMIHPADREIQRRALADALQGSHPYDVEFRVIRPDGEVRFVHCWDEIVHDGSGRPSRMFSTVQDVTERKRAEDEIRRQREVLQTIFDSAPIGINFFTADGRPIGTDVFTADGRFAMVNREWERIVGWTLKELEEQNRDPFEEAIPDPRERELAHGVLAAATGEWVDLAIRSRDGRTVDVSACVVPLSDGTRLGLLQDITERKRADEALRDSATRLQHLSRRLFDVQEEERRHIARELHDEFGQLLATISLHIHAAKGAAGPAAQPQLDECMALLRRAGEQVRRLAIQLRPPMLETAGLDAAVRWLAEQHQRQTGVVTHVAGHVHDVPGDLAIACFRVTQEALTNVVRHARARHAWIELSQSEALLEVVVRDDGAGFDVDRTLEQAAARGSLGLLGMRERVELVGGKLEVDSAPGRGASIRAAFPLAEGAPDPTGRAE